MRQANDNSGAEAHARAFTMPAKGVGRALPRRSDLVVDLTGVRELDFTNLALLLTAQQNAQRENREVWLAGVPLNVWESLHIMGVGRFFRPFPVSGALSA